MLRASQRQNIWGNTSIPKNILHDNEQLYEESLNLKKTMNMLKSENTQLKTKMLQGERELLKKDKEIKRLIEQLNTPSITNITKDQPNKKPLKTGTQLVINLKKHITEIQKENHILKEGLADYKKNLKTTKIQELESEVKAYLAECLRLRNLLEKIMAEKPYITMDGITKAEEKMKEQNELIEKLKEENEKLSIKVKEVTEEALEWKNKAEQKEICKHLATEQNKEISDLKGQISHMKKDRKSVV